MWLCCYKASKIDEYLDIKNCSREKCLFDKLMLAFEDEILNTTETLIVGRKVMWEKIMALFTRFH